MKIEIHTDNPVALKKAILVNIKDETLRTWKVVTDTNDDKLITHKAGQYKDDVLLRLTPTKDGDILKVTTTYWESHDKPDEAEIAIYLGMFTSALLTHFSDDYRKLEVYS